jgi:hypothetical protein
MSVKSTLIALGVVLIFIALGYFYGEKKYDTGYDDAINSITLDSTVTTADTVYTKGREVTVYIPYYVKAIVDTVDESIIYSTELDTSVVIEQDTVVTLKQDISFSEGFFNILTDLVIKPIKETVTINTTQFQTVVKEIPVSQFPNTFLTGFASALIIAIVSLILLI